MKKIFLIFLLFAVSISAQWTPSVSDTVVIVQDAAQFFNVRDTSRESYYKTVSIPQDDTIYNTGIDLVNRNVTGIIVTSAGELQADKIGFYVSADGSNYYRLYADSSGLIKPLWFKYAYDEAINVEIKELYNWRYVKPVINTANTSSGMTITFATEGM